VRVALVVGRVRGRGELELGPALGVGEGGGDDVLVGGVGRVEGDDARAVGVVDVAQVGEPEGVD
jgi:hypothetical protein